ncbi:MAG: SDR family NAD(P)-dependent oxidoreductase, partial [Dehalococcoidia bacterium]|nr:SDR family NAD(P)-dependent oxidoreductase [Dehalococcoidia bacterium]
MDRDRSPVVVITGASRGIGRETAQLLARSGYRVFAGVRDVDRAAVVRAYADRLNLPLELVQLDVTSQEST